MFLLHDNNCNHYTLLLLILFLLFYSYIQAGNAFSDIISKKSFAEPRVAGIRDTTTRLQQCFVNSENAVLLEVKPPTVFAAMQTVLAVYYSLHISYPKTSIPAKSVLLFLQEKILQKIDTASNKPVRYNNLVNTLD